MATRFITAAYDETERLSEAAGMPLGATVAAVIFQRDIGAVMVQGPDGTNWARQLSNYDADILYSKTVTISTALANAGTTLLAGEAGVQYELVDWFMIAVGGNAATATSVRLRGTVSASVVNLATVAIAALTRSTVVKPNSANVTNLTDGAWANATLDDNTGIELDVDNDNLATATSLVIGLSYRKIY